VKPIAALVILLALTAGAIAAQETSFIEGTILDRETKEPLPAFVLVAGGSGISADGRGRFKIALPLSAGPRIRLTVWLIGYRIKEIEAEAGTSVKVELDLEPLAVQEVTVTADAVVSDEKNPKTVSLTKMEVYTLPGAAADPLYASHILPGVNSPPDASSLLIRGGSPDEVGFYFDGIRIAHPFLSESLHESYFSVFDNQVVDRFSVATSGFHPKYGDSLSGVMDIAAKDVPAGSEGGLGLSVLGLNSYVAFPLKGVGGFVGSYDRGFSDILVRLNSRGGGREFQTEHAFGKFLVRLGAANQVRIYGMADRYRYSQSAGTAFDVSTENDLAALSWTCAPRKNFAFKALVARTTYDMSFDQPGTVRVESRDTGFQTRLDAVLDLGRHYLEAGAESASRTLRTSILDPVSADSAFRGSGLGFYVQDKFRLSGRTYIHLGGRASSFEASGRRWGIDPRLSAAFLLTKKDILRASAGLYHQFGDVSTLGQNPGLKPKASAHFALSYDRIAENFDIRISLYDKEYRGLFLAGADGRLWNAGKGFARGAEFFLKRKAPSYEAVLVYNFLSSKRKENDIAALAPSPYEIPHSATGIFTWNVKNGSLGIRYSIASGRPYTPLAGKEWDEAAQSYEFVWAAPMSARYPFYQRLDLNGSLRVQAFGRMLVLYVGITNLLNSQNIIRYDYGAEDGSRQDQQSIFGRSFFAGLYVPFF